MCSHLSKKFVKFCCANGILPGSYLRFNRLKTSKSRNYYEVLGIKNDAETKDIRDAFVKLSKQVHPDRNPNDPLNHEKFVALNEAYGVLCKPQSRQAYDASLNSTRGYHQENLAYNFRTGYRHTTGDAANPHGTGNIDEQHHQQVFWDETIWHMRDKSKDRVYSSADERWFMKKRTNSWVVLECVGLLLAGTVLFFLGMRWSGRIRERMRVRSQEIAASLDRDRSDIKARGFEKHIQHLEMQIAAREQAIKRRREQENAAKPGR